MDLATIIALGIKYGPEVVGLIEQYGPTVVGIVKAVAPVVQGVVTDLNLQSASHQIQTNAVLSSIDHRGMTDKEWAKFEQDLAWMGKTDYKGG